MACYRVGMAILCFEWGDTAMPSIGFPVEAIEAGTDRFNFTHRILHSYSTFYTAIQRGNSGCSSWILFLGNELHRSRCGDGILNPIK